MARHLAVQSEEQGTPSELAHLAAPPANEQAPAWSEVADDGEEPGLDPPGDGPTLACQWDKEDLEVLGLWRLDVSPSASLASAGAEAGEPDAQTAAAAWRLLEAGDSLCVAQVETVALRMLLKRAHELAQLRSSSGQALTSVEDLAQLLALWRPGAYKEEREQAYFDVRFARQRPTYPHPSVAAVLDRTSGQLLCAEQVIELLQLLGFDWAQGDAFRPALARGRMAERVEHERTLRKQAKQRGWSQDSISACAARLQQRAAVSGLVPLAGVPHLRHVGCYGATPTTQPLKPTSPYSRDQLR
jgi:hypothetical protein